MQGGLHRIEDPSGQKYFWFFVLVVSVLFNMGCLLSVTQLLICFQGRRAPRRARGVPKKGQPRPGRLLDGPGGSQGEPGPYPHPLPPELPKTPRTPLKNILENPRHTEGPGSPREGWVHTPTPYLSKSPQNLGKPFKNMLEDTQGITSLMLVRFGPLKKMKRLEGSISCVFMPEGHTEGGGSRRPAQNVSVPWES